MRSFFASLRHVAADLRLAMCKLNEMQFSAPWAPRRTRYN
jgi:hypothetical protein